MSDAKPLPLWPFVAVDALFLGLAALLLKFGHHPLSWQESGMMVLCGALGSWSFVTPFLRRSADEQALSQAKLLADAAGQIQKLDQLAAQISGATNQWLELQANTSQAAANAKQVADAMAAEARTFSEFLQRAGETEKAHLRVEVEKLHRAEGERLQIVIQVLDRVYALYQAARRCGEPGLIEQIGHFQKDCRDVVRRIGLVAIEVPEGETYDPEDHHLPENVMATEDSVVAVTLACGYMYQGKRLRKPAVELKG